MYLGRRKVRSAGRNSGSVEVTLPVQLGVLEGVECRLVVRDGARPELVLEPELGEVQALFRDVWAKLGVGLAEVDEIGDYSPAEFTLTLFPPPGAHERPVLSYADGLLALRHRALHGSVGSPESVSGMEGLCRVLAALASVAGYRLGLTRALAQIFGDGLAYLVTGVIVGLGSDFERGTAHQAFQNEGGEGEGGAASPCLPSPHDDRTWRLAQPGLARVFQQHRAWQANPELYEAARDRWYMALTLEMGVAASASATGTPKGRSYSL